MAQFTHSFNTLSILDDGTTHTLSLTSTTGRYFYTIRHVGIETALAAHLTREQATRLVDQWDEDCNEGRALLVDCDDEALVNFRNGR